MLILLTTARVRCVVSMTGTVDTKAPPELTVSEAYNMLTQNINNMGLSFFIEEDNEEVSCSGLFLSANNL